MIFLKRFAKYCSVRTNLNGLYNFNRFVYGFTKYEYAIGREKRHIFTFYYVSQILQRLLIEMPIMPNIPNIPNIPDTLVMSDYIVVNLALYYKKQSAEYSVEYINIEFHNDKPYVIRFMGTVINLS